MLKKLDYYFLLALVINLILKILLFSSTPLFIDSYTYLFATDNIINLEYSSYRAPFFPLLIAPLFLLTGEAFTAIKITSLLMGIILVITSYLVFTKAAMKLFQGNKKDKIKKGKYVGLLVSFLLEFNLYLLSHNLKGLREELLCILCILIFYFTVIKEEPTLKTNIYLALSICFLTLTLLTAGIFITFGILIFYLFCKIKRFNLKSITQRKLLIILFSFALSFGLWAIFNFHKSFPIFYSLEVQKNWFKFEYNIEIASFGDLIDASINALLFGIPSIFIYFLSLIGFVFILLVVYVLTKNFYKKQFLFLFFFIGMNLAYLSVFITTPRIILYFFPFFFYIGAFTIIKRFFNIENQKKKMMIFLILIFLITYIIRGMDNLSIIHLLLSIYKDAPLIINFDKIWVQFYVVYSPLRTIISIIFLIINEISLLLFILKSKSEEKSLYCPINQNPRLRLIATLRRKIL
jgi:hypothetical protein